MTREKEVLRMALEAFKEINYDQAYSTEITAIKEALAQPEQIPPSAYSNTHQPEQEPVAWLHVMDNTEGLKANGTGIVLITQKRKHPFGKPGIDFSKSYPVTSTPLYTAPPQRKPLTDEQKMALCKQFPDHLTFNAIHAIEAAHGIKE